MQYRCKVIKEQEKPFKSGIGKGYTLNVDRIYWTTKDKRGVNLSGYFIDRIQKRKSYLSIIVTQEFCKKHLQILKK